MVRVITLLWILSVSIWAESGAVRGAWSPAIIGREMPSFYNGYLYSCEPRHIVTLFAPDGHMVLTLPIQGLGNGKVKVLAVAIDSDATLAIAWSWWDPPSAGIEVRDSSGNLIRAINTGRYIPAHISFGGDHSLWGFGWQRDADNPTDRDKLDYPTVRKYSIDGKEIGAYLPRSLFSPGLEPGMDEWQERRITVTADRVGIEAVSGNVSTQREWVELDLNGNLTGRWKLDPFDKFPGVALTSDNHAYVPRYDHQVKSWRVFRLDRARSIWEPMEAPNANLYGADGDNLVFAQWTGGVMHMSWYPQPQIFLPTSTTRK